MRRKIIKLISIMLAVSTIIMSSILQPAFADSTPESDLISFGETKVTTCVDSFGNKWTVAAVAVKNNSERIVLIPWGSIDLNDKDGNKVSEINYVGAYPEVVLPNEIAWLYGETFFDEELPEVFPVPHIEPQVFEDDCIRYEMNDIVIENNESEGITIKGTVTNDTECKGTFVSVAVNMYGKDCEFICNAFAFGIDTFEAGESKDFSVSPFSFPEGFCKDDIVYYEAYAYPWQYRD